MKRKIFVWRPGLPGNLQSVAPLRSCAFLMSSVGQKKGTGTPESAFWACFSAVSRGSYSIRWGFAGSEGSRALGVCTEDAVCNRGMLWARLCLLLALVDWREVEQPTQHSTPTCKKLKSSPKSSATLHDVFQCILPSPRQPEFSGSKAEGKISGGLNHGWQMLVSLNCSDGVGLCSKWYKPCF